MARVNKKTAPEKYIFGKYAVGTQRFSFVDTGRKEILGNAAGDRKIAVRMYYPVNPDSVVGKERAIVFSENKSAAIRKSYHIRKVPDGVNFADYYEDVPMPEGSRFPLIMFSMGYNSYIESNTYLLCALASYGYIVASVGHAYEGVENDYEDGSFDLFDKKINKVVSSKRFATIRAQNKLLKAKLSYQDALDQFDELQKKYPAYAFIKGRVPEWKKDIEKALEEVKARYGDSIDLSRGVGASGHSLGGCLAYYLCRYNKEFTCGINIDGALLGEYPEKRMDRPFCQISCLENVNVETRSFINTVADTYQVTFAEMKHLGFTDLKFFIPIKLLAGKLDSEEMFRHLVYCHSRFFDKYLKCEDIEFKGMKSDKVKYVKVV